MMSSVLQAACAYVFSPLLDLNDLKFAASIDKNESERKRIDNLVESERPGEPVDAGCAAKLREIILNLGYNPDQVILLQRDQDVESVAQDWSLATEGKWFIYFTSDILQEMQDNILPHHQFLISNALAVCKLQKEQNYLVERIRAICKCKLLTYVGMMGLSNYFLPGLGYFVTHVVSVGFSLCSGKLCGWSTEKNLAKLADLKSVENKPELAKAAIELFKAAQLTCQQRKSENCENYLYYDSKGNNRLDFSHPTSSERIAYLQPYATVAR